MVRPDLIGTYNPPPVEPGDRVTCLYRKARCVVTAWHDGRIPWPRVRAVRSRGGSGLWVNRDLSRAIRTESAEALMYWFGVGPHAVWNWRKNAHVGRTGTQGSRAAHRAASRKGAAAMKQKPWLPSQRLAHRGRAERLGLRPIGRWKGREWTPEQLALLGTDHDEAIARRIGRTRSAVTNRRLLLDIPAFSGWAGGGRPWTPEELVLLGTDHDEAIARKLDRTPSAVTQRRLACGAPPTWTAGRPAAGDAVTDRDAFLAEVLNCQTDAAGNAGAGSGTAKPGWVDGPCWKRAAELERRAG